MIVYNCSRTWWPRVSSGCAWLPSTAAGSATWRNPRGRWQLGVKLSIVGVKACGSHDLSTIRRYNKQNHHKPSIIHGINKQTIHIIHDGPWSRDLSKSSQTIHQPGALINRHRPSFTTRTITIDSCCHPAYHWSLFWLLCLLLLNHLVPSSIVAPPLLSIH